MTLPLMNPDGNPVTAGAPVHAREGQLVTAPFKNFRHGEVITSAMSAPTVRNEHVTFLGRAKTAEFVVETPDGVTQYTIHYGRWVEGGKGVAEFGGWLELGSVVVSSTTDGELNGVEFDARGDGVGIYVDTITGTATESFRMWVRGIG